MKFNNEHTIQLLNRFLSFKFSAYRFERRNGLIHGLIDKAKQEFIDNGIHTRLVEKLDDK